MKPDPQMRLPTQPTLDQAIRDYIETTHFYDEQTGELYEPAVPPAVDDDEDDEDAR